MDSLLEFINNFNKRFHHLEYPFRLIEYGPYVTSPDCKISIGVELQWVLELNRFKTIFVVSSLCKDAKDSTINEAINNVIDSFNNIDFEQYVKELVRWKEN